MKRWFFSSLILSGFISGVSGQSGWVRQNSGTTANLYSVYFPTPLIGYAAGDSGVILKTTDGGINWGPLSSNVPSFLKSSYFIDSNLGWIVGSGPTILKTMDGGASFQIQNTGITTAYNLFSIHFVDSNYGWAVGGSAGIPPMTNRLILKTSNGGINWSIVKDTAGPPLLSTHFTDPNTGWVVGGLTFCVTGCASYITALKTTDGGAAWSQLQPLQIGRSVHFVNTNTGWIVGNDAPFRAGWQIPVISKSINGGSSWVSQTVPSQLSAPGSLSSMHFQNTDTGWVAGNRGVILNTIDGGANWNLQISSTSANLRAIQFVDAVNGWAVGDSGVILKTIDGGGLVVDVWQEISITVEPFLFSLNKFRYQLPRLSRVKAILYRTDGKAAAVLVNGPQASGEHIVDISASKIPAGIYILNFTAGDAMRKANTVVIP